MNKSLLLLINLVSLLPLSGCNFNEVSSSIDSGGSSNETSSSSSQGSSSASSSLTGDSSSTSGDSSSDSSSSSSSSLPIDEDVALPASQEYLDFFSLDKGLALSLSFKGTSLEDLSSCQKDKSDSRLHDVYFPADLTFKMNNVDYTYNDVGVRMKGNTSRNDIFNNGVMTNSVHFKVSFKATFDGDEYDLDSRVSKYKVDWSSDAAGRKERKKRTLFGMEKVDLKYIPRNSGACVGQEVYAYHEFESQGLLAPKASILNLSLVYNGATKTGFYEAVECLDDVFLKRHFSKEEAKGDLYKCVYGPKGKADYSRDGAVNKTFDSDGFANGTRIKSGKIGIEDNVNGYHPSYELKTNDDLGEDGTFEAITNFINAMWSLRYKKGSKSLLESVLDVPYFLKFSALSEMLGGPDDQRHDWNNFYLYFLPSTNQALYIPYDWDWCLGSDWDNSRKFSSLTAFNEYTVDGSNQCSNIYYATFFKSETMAYDKTGYQNQYSSYISSMLTQGVLSSSSYVSLLSQCPLFSTSTCPSSISQYMSDRTSSLRS